MLIFGFFCSATKETRRRGGGISPSPFLPRWAKLSTTKKDRLSAVFLAFIYTL
jgi:hypothetical protein